MSKTRSIKYPCLKDKLLTVKESRILLPFLKNPLQNMDDKIFFVTTKSHNGSFTQATFLNNKGEAVSGFAFHKKGDEDNAEQALKIATGRAAGLYAKLASTKEAKPSPNYRELITTIIKTLYANNGVRR